MTVLLQALENLRAALDELDEFKVANGGGGWHLWLRTTPPGDPTPSREFPQGTIAAVTGQGGIPTTVVETGIVQLGVQIEHRWNQDEDAASGWQQINYLHAIVHRVVMRADPDPFGELAHVLRAVQWDYVDAPDDRETVIAAILVYELDLQTKRGDMFEVAG